MSDLTSIQKLDLVLNFLAKNKKARAAFMPFILIEQGLNHIDFDGNELYKILRKLEKDNLVYYEEIKLPVAGTVYAYGISLEGEIFNEQGGYTQKIINDASENKRLETLEHSQRVNANRMTYLTIVIAVGTFVAACYYAVELWKYFHPN